MISLVLPDCLQFHTEHVYTGTYTVSDDTLHKGGPCPTSIGECIRKTNNVIDCYSVAVT